jgi:hypothetical protein
MKTLFVDIETSPTLAYVYDYYDTNIVKIVDNWKLMSIAWKWEGEKKISVCSTRTKTEKELVELAHKLYTEADVVVGFNSIRFDDKKLLAKFIEFDLAPVSYRAVDVMKIAKNASFISNSLDNLCKTLLGEGKSDITYKDLWFDCLQNDARAYRLLEKYNKKDVDLTYRLYNRLKPYSRASQVPNMAIEKGYCCRVCGSKNLQSRGFTYTRTRKYRRLQCNDCHAWSQEIEPDDSGVVVETK